jgi:CelD/BcsL family acetyltransferase involved in cellulose biosynthesis
MSCEVRMETMQDQAALEGLQGSWSKLLQQSCTNNIFLTWEWLSTWFRHLGEGRRLFIVTVLRGSEVVALLPLATSPRAWDRILRVRTVEFLGTGKAGSDYLDIIINRDCEQEALSLLTGFAEERRLVLRFAQVKPEGSLVSRWGARLEGRGWRLDKARTNICPYIPLAGHTWQSYLGTLGAEHRYNVQRKLRNLKKHFDVAFERACSKSQCRQALSLLLELHNQRWRARGGSDAFFTRRLVAFHEDFIELALARNWLRLFVLRLNGRPAASLYGLRYNDVFYFYQSGFDPAYCKYSVGLAAMAFSIQAAIEEGAAEYDLLHGGEAYKFHWSRTVRSIGRVEAYPPGLSGSLYAEAVRLQRASRRLARRVLPKTLTDAIAAPNGPSQATYASNPG